MKVFSLRWTFLLAFVLLVLLTATASIVNNLAQRQLMTQFETLSEVSAPTVIALNQVNTAVLRIQQEAMQIVFLSESRAIGPEDMAAMETANARLNYWLLQYARYAPENAESLRRLSEQVAAESQTLAEMAAAGGDTEAFLAQETIMEEADDTYSFLLNSLLDTAQVEFNVQREQAAETTEQTQRRSVAMLGVSMLGAILIGLTLSFHTLRPIVRLKNIAVRIAKGDDARALKYPNNEIGVLAREFNHMADTLERKAEEANAANTFKTQLLARVSHELRTPLGAVIGMAGMLQSNGLKQDERELVGYILKYSYELHDMVNELLEQSRWEVSGKNRTLQVTEANPRDMLDDVVRKVQSRATEQGITLRVDCDDTLPEAVWVDETKMRHILNNLVTNAVKFTQEGEVVVRGYTPAPGQWAIQVTDTGIGIPPEHLATIFQAFRQVDESNTRSYGGVGLGLAIVEQFVKLMDGEITVKSKQGEGSTFTVTLPVRVEQRQAA